jgi:mutual gliding-motility protein MglA
MIKQSRHVLNIKIVYYGPALSGKTTNVINLHNVTHNNLKGEMMVLDAKNDRTLFFDLLPLGIQLNPNLLVKLKIYTVPGQVAHDSTRKAVLSGADGVVFVADSQITQKQNNALSFESLMDNITRVGLAPDKLPIAIQFNKRDLNPIIPEDDIIKHWAQTPWPVHFSSALNGQGVKETFNGLLEKIIPKASEDIADADERINYSQQIFSRLFV